MLDLYNSGFESFCSGRKERLLLAGDDSEICIWHLLIGKKLWYDESLFFHHFIIKSRLSKDYLLNITEGFQMSEKILNLYKEVLFYKESNKFTRIKILFRRFKNLLFNYKNYFPIYYKLNHINKSLTNYLKLGHQ